MWASRLREYLSVFRRKILLASWVAMVGLTIFISSGSLTPLQAVLSIVAAGLVLVVEMTYSIVAATNVRWTRSDYISHFKRIPRVKRVLRGYTKATYVTIRRASQIDEADLIWQVDEIEKLIATTARLSLLGRVWPFLKNVALTVVTLTVMLMSLEAVTGRSLLDGGAVASRSGFVEALHATAATIFLVGYDHMANNDLAREFSIVCILTGIIMLIIGFAVVQTRGGALAAASRSAIRDQLIAGGHLSHATHRKRDGGSGDGEAEMNGDGAQPTEPPVGVPRQSHGDPETLALGT